MVLTVINLALALGNDPGKMGDVDTGHVDGAVCL